MRFLQLEWLVAMALTFGAAGQNAPRRPPMPRPGTLATSSATQPASSVCLMTWVTHYGADGAHVLDLLVLWRGTPGWFMANTGGAGTSGGGRTGFYQTTIRYGGLELQLSFDGAARTAYIQGKPVKLGDDNVILVDHVNSTEGPQVASTLRVEPDVPAGEGTRPRVEEVVRRSPEIIDFLQCDATLPGGKNQALIDRLCTMMLGK